MTTNVVMNSGAYSYGLMGAGPTDRQSEVEKFYGNLSDATVESDTKGVGDPLGLTMIPYGNTNISYGMVAYYSEDSTPDDPIIKVSSNYGGQDRAYNVHVNRVNPKNASELEMFALLSYSDDVGITDGGSFGSFHKLKVTASNANLYGIGEDVYDYENFTKVKQDWIEIMKSMMSVYMDIPQTYKQGVEVADLIMGLETLYDHNIAQVEKTENKGISSASKEFINPLYGVKKTGESNFHWKRDDAMRQTSYSVEHRETVGDKEVPTYLVGNTYYSEKGIVFEGIHKDKDGEVVSQKVQWTVRFDREETYEKAMDFLDGFDENDKMKFAGNKQFWQDFVSGKLDIKEFKKFYDSSTENGNFSFLSNNEDGTQQIKSDEASRKYGGYFSGSMFNVLTLDEVEAIFFGNRIDPYEGKSVSDVMDELNSQAERENEEDADYLSLIVDIIEETRKKLLANINGEHKETEGLMMFSDEEWENLLSKVDMQIEAAREENERKMQERIAALLADRDESE